MVTKLCVVSLGVTLRMVVQLKSNSNIIIEILVEAKHTTTRVIGLQLPGQTVKFDCHLKPLTSPHPVNFFL